MWGEVWEGFRTKTEAEPGTLNLKRILRRTGIAPLSEKKHGPLPEKCLHHLDKEVTPSLPAAQASVREA